jgi:thiamine pyrophosphate-dependent acetolactate synthase large subunit-like protein
MRGGEAVAEVLVREGVEVVFCLPSNALIDEAAARGIRPIVGREERSVINMADAYSRMHDGRRIGVCMVQHGPGAEHAFGGIAQAYADSVPVLFLPSGMARPRLGVRTTFDAVTAYRPVAKWSSRFNTAASVPHQLRRAFQQLRSGRPGPVVLEMPADVVTEEFDAGLFGYTPPARPRSQADPAEVARAVDLLLAAERPIIHVGQGVLWARASAALVEFAELAEAPVMTTYTAKSAFPENHPLALGCGGVAITPQIHELLPDADLIFSVGASLARTLASFPIPAGKTMIQATNDPDDLSMEYDLAVGLVGDAALVLGQLCDQLRSRASGRAGGRDSGRDRRGVRERVAQARERAASEWAAKLTSDEVPVNPLRVVAEVIAATDPDQTVITHDSGYPRDHLAPHYVSTVPRGYLGWGNSTPLGSSIGLALGAKAAAPGKTVVAFLGDAAFGQSGLELETSVRCGLPLLCVLVNNSEMGNYEKLQPIAQEKFGIKHLSGRYAEVARALGADAERVERPEDLAPALRRALAAVGAGRTVLLEVITRPEPAFVRPLS